jgi:hypothetical protein
MLSPAFSPPCSPAGEVGPVPNRTLRVALGAGVSSEDPHAAAALIADCELRLQVECHTAAMPHAVVVPARGNTVGRLAPRPGHCAGVHEVAPAPQPCFVLPACAGLP